jgi:hypothetical protein
MSPDTAPDLQRLFDILTAGRYLAADSPDVPEAIVAAIEAIIEALRDVEQALAGEKKREERKKKDDQ